jgi:hypothetical protein
MRHLLGLGLAVGLVCSPPLLQADDDEWKDRLKGVVIQHFLPEREFVLQQDGAKGDVKHYHRRSSEIRKYAKNAVRDGKLIENDEGELRSQERAKVFRTGDRLGLAQVQINSKNISFGDTPSIVCRGIDCIGLWFESSEVVDRGDSKERYVGWIVYEFPKGYLERADSAEVLKAIDRVAMPAKSAPQNQPKTISLGLTASEVEGVLGKPEKVIDLGAKKTYIYKDMKVIFVNGKVTDVQ